MGKRGRAEEDPSAREEPRNKSTMRRAEYQIKRQKASAARAHVIRATCSGRGLPDDSEEESGPLWRSENASGRHSYY